MALTINQTWGNDMALLPITYDIGASLRYPEYIISVPTKGNAEVSIDMTSPPSPTDTFKIFDIEFRVTGSNSSNTIALGANIYEFATNVAAMLNRNFKTAYKFSYSIAASSSLQGNITFTWNELFQEISNFSTDNTSFMTIINENAGGNAVETENIVFLYSLLVDNPSEIIMSYVANADYFTLRPVGETQKHIPILTQPTFDSVQPITIYFNNELEQIVSTTKPFNVTTFAIDKNFSRIFKIQGGIATQNITSVSMLQSIQTLAGRALNMRLQRNDLITDYNTQATTTAKFLTSRPRKQYYITRNSYQWLWFHWNFEQGFINQCFDANIENIRILFIVIVTDNNGNTYYGDFIDGVMSLPLMQSVAAEVSHRTIFFPCGTANHIPNFPNVANENIKKYTIEIGYYDDTSPTTDFYSNSEIMTFDVCHFEGSFEVYFLCDFGGWDTMIFENVAEKTVNALRQHAQISEKYTDNFTSVSFNRKSKQQVVLRSIPMTYSDEIELFFSNFQRAREYAFKDKHNVFRQLRISSNDIALFKIGETARIEVAFEIDLL